MSATATSPAARPAAAFTTVLNAAVGSAASRLDEQVTRWTRKLNDVASGEVADLADQGLDDLAGSGDALQSAGASGLRAKLNGGSPFRAAVKGLWQAGSPAVRAAVVTAVVATILLLLVSPVLLLVFLLSLLVIAAVQRARRSAS
jgi:hypothetical protein